MDYSELGPEKLGQIVEQVLQHAQQNVAPIVQLGHPALRQPALPYDGQLDAPTLNELLLVMRHTMHAAPGVGLAAVQLGIPLQLAVLEDRYPIDADAAREREREPLDYLEFINPGYTPIGARQAAFYEGCLSFNDFQAVVSRPTAVHASYLDRDGNPQERDFSGWQARIVQHEIDHLCGTVYIDRAETRSLVCASEAFRYPGFDLDQARSLLGF